MSEHDSLTGLTVTVTVGDIPTLDTVYQASGLSMMTNSLLTGLSHYMYVISNLVAVYKHTYGVVYNIFSHRKAFRKKYL